MKNCYIILVLTLLSNTIFAQSSTVGRFSGVMHAPLSSSTTKDNILHSTWQISVHPLYEKNKSSIFHTQEIKKQKNIEKSKTQQSTIQFDKKIRGNAPTIGTNFEGNELKTWTPTDNSIAVSKGGKIVSCINFSIEYYDTAGNNFLLQQTWNDFINDTTLSQPKFDPKVIYDNIHDRFVLVILHGTNASKSKIVVCFSKTNDPVDGWNIYTLSGDPGIDTAWSDYPSIGINDDELFINCNRFGNPPNYEWKQSYIYQIGLQEGYNAQTLNYGVWDSLLAEDNEEPITMYPASHGFGSSLKDRMYFVYARPDSGSKVYLHELHGNLNSTTQSMTSKSYAIPHFEVCGNAFQKDPTTGFLDSLSTGSAWIMNAVYSDSVIHFVQNADYALGWCGIHYGRIYLDSNKAEVKVFGNVGTDLAYPAVATIGYTSKEKGVAIAYLRSDQNITPETGIVTVDDAFQFSTAQTVKAGDTSVNILYPPNYPIMPERWGDYTGICRKYNTNTPEVWMAGAYGSNTLPRKASMSTWIAQIITNDSAVAINTATPNTLISKTASKVYPNPITDLFVLEFENAKDGLVNIALLDMNGKLVKNLFEGDLPKSITKLTFNKKMLTPGVYFVSISKANQTTETISVQIN
ncbi:MAG: T9SS type A sorting domain-containing protein [Chitinophagaceae bacterium]